ncbi:2,3-bisphosphoglycerate-independent phosphoglycerate mutase [Dasania sp. GY-MA-18]|uniref:2,3-bisphosphoglycerate-independent phosphoglycerate mutase n=1 Tax=Dasania phycosphaerae TaxID=2950436 RepID=A0A9J6RM64_9GAMM|nr:MULTISPECIES: 2,3-bisphosphoglycerate-independent phosphoglycerate mutase [Dasania]MCR8923035.1 2,3-bisphosphoglycerate-independent phosphoglycerate mutase [Dasania sp. GY-MA-18]MCZ0865466.1 2,3-bisphosphoglycerate-independent phosphoglycerate mutase [Dasania phycosphaerae]MCZ0869191.1 2,3-bisphosphoglycerate-independent phosphoglycerate mutase [Dasania phycosphaerae]
MNTENPKKPVVLVILDGWGHREAPEDNAIYHAHTPNWDNLLKQYPNTLISGSGPDVGLPEGQMGNSEVGHMSLGAGRVVYQNISRIDKAIADGDFFQNPAYINAIDKAQAQGKAVHIFGLLSAGGVHSHENHIAAMVKMAAQRGAEKVYVHAFLDGRDTPPRSALPSLQALDQQFKQLGCGRIASLVGRYHVMDRDNRWERVQPAYELLTQAKAAYRYDNASAALAAAYARDENDEFVAPSVIQAEGEAEASINDGDSVIFMNFRADRAREITRAFVDSDFAGFERAKTPALASFVMSTEYAADIKADCAFPPEKLTNSFGELMAKLGKKQLRIAETEKYAHVTFFFSGGRESLYQGEDRELIPSPDVATYDLKPEMSAPEVTEKLCAAMASGKYDAIICNYANGDMVGHTGVFSAAVKAAEAIDASVKAVTDAALAHGFDCLITADHGNCEQMHDHESGQAHTQHTTEHVPFVYVGKRTVSIAKPNGRLADVAPTMLALMGLKQPAEMTGESLLNIAD